MPEDLTPSAPSSPSGGGSATPAPSSAPTAAPSGSPSAEPAAKPTGYSYPEDRSRWIPPHRLQQESQRRQELEHAIAERDRRIAALAGVTPQRPEEAQAEQARQAFLELFPRFAKLNDETLDRLITLAENADTIQETAGATWTRHGTHVLSSLIGKAQEMLGGQLQPRAQTRLRQAFVSFIENDVTRAQRNGMASPLLQRYEAGDETLLDEFLKDWADDFFVPAQRKVTQQAVNRSRPVVSSTGRSQVTTVQRPATFKNLDERLDYAAKLAKERGVQFGRD